MSNVVSDGMEPWAAAFDDGREACRKAAPADRLLMPTDQPTPYQTMYARGWNYERRRLEH